MSNQQPELYDLIYADPPWRYDFSRTKNRRIENQYPTMSIDEICALTVPAKRDAVLYLWATSPKLLEALRVMEAWGFQYKSQAVWDKEIPGMGYWFRGQHEILLVGTRGKFSPPIPALRVSSVFKVRRARHSAKPAEVRDMLTACFPRAACLEMFARSRTPGWAVWGNEV